MSERLTDRDKWLHFIVCLAVSIICPLFAIGLAIGKEYGDSKAQGNHWCWFDLLADGIGILLGTTFHALIVYAIIR